MLWTRFKGQNTPKSPIRRFFSASTPFRLLGQYLLVVAPGVELIAYVIGLAKRALSHLPSPSGNEQDVILLVEYGADFNAPRYSVTVCSLSGTLSSADRTDEHVVMPLQLAYNISTEAPTQLAFRCAEYAFYASGTAQRDTWGRRTLCIHRYHERAPTVAARHNHSRRLTRRLVHLHRRALDCPGADSDVAGTGEVYVRVERGLRGFKVS
ncbi:hypothetical protein EXIGLDRAFT_707476 [Exidia glandulosa HHB12029]|uniref:Uncharacterized protein n=1 Tax=Exidia glandulosa HHB12029 TaxID=1314781 RepID=A0A165JU86_EXIGL|nr:hypothetical protein EXIGLDRAFT_707476 [Exidia glandulosa HHB12029]